MTAKIVYEGNLRCSSTHVQSGSAIETDAPTDNRGKGERFSPTDLLCTSLATCMITTMGIKAGDMNINLKNTHIEVTKHMLSAPRRVGKIELTLFMVADAASASDKELLEKVGNQCPVIKSLHPDIDIQTKYQWQ